jgi:hypothetical protein
MLASITKWVGVIITKWKVKQDRVIRFKYINQQDATVSQVYYLTFMCGSTCFRRLFAHHQERTAALEASGFTVGALLVMVVRPRPTMLQPHLHRLPPPNRLNVEYVWMLYLLKCDSCVFYLFICDVLD